MFCCVLLRVICDMLIVKLVYNLISPLYCRLGCLSPKSRDCSLYALRKGRVVARWRSFYGKRGLSSCFTLSPALDLHNSIESVGLRRACQPPEKRSLVTVEVPSVAHVARDVIHYVVHALDETLIEDAVYTVSLYQVR